MKSIRDLVKSFFSRDKTDEIDKTEAVYVVNNVTYERDFAPIYGNLDFEVNHIYQCPIILPFYIPMDEGGCITMVVDEHMAFTIIFHEVNSTNAFDDGLVSKEKFKIPIKRSRVELLLVSDKEDFTFDGEASDDGTSFRSFLFDTCIDHLNFFITSFKISQKDRDVYRINLSMLQTMSLIRIIRVSDWSYEHSIFMLHHNIPYIKKRLTMEQQEDVIHYASVIKRERNPMILSEELMLDAYRKINEGFYNDALITAQTSLESLIRNLARELLILEGKSETEVLTWMEDTPFMSIIKTKMGGWIGGRWDKSHIGSPVQTWYDNGYSLRNRVIHTGRNVEKTEVIEAINTINEMRVFTIEVLRKRKKKFPGIWRYFE